MKQNRANQGKDSRGKKKGNNYTEPKISISMKISNHENSKEL